METLKGREPHYTKRELPQHVLEVAQLADPGPDGPIHPRQLHVVLAAEFAALRDTLNHFTPPEPKGGPPNNTRFYLKGFERAASAYSQAMTTVITQSAVLTSHLVGVHETWFPSSIFGEEGDPFTASQAELQRHAETRGFEWDAYDDAIRTLALGLPVSARQDFCFGWSRDERFPTYSRLADKAFDEYDNALEWCRVATGHYGRLIDLAGVPDKGQVAKMNERLTLFPGRALLEAMHLANPAGSQVLDGPFQEPSLIDHTLPGAPDQIVDT